MCQSSSKLIKTEEQPLTNSMKKHEQKFAIILSSTRKINKGEIFVSKHSMHENYLLTIRLRHERERKRKHTEALLIPLDRILDSLCSLD